MSERNETWRELAADIRKRAECPLRHGEERITSGEAIGNLLLDIARRVEETGERMRAEWEAKTLREVAVSREEQRMEYKARLDEAAKLRGVVERITTWCHEDGCGFCVGDREQMVKDALKEPPRNCNRFAEWEDALRWYENAMSPDWVKNWRRSDWIEFSKWLFATRWDWRPGMPEPSTQKGASAEGVGEKGAGAVNSTKTQKDGVLSCGADGAAPAGQGRETVTNRNGFGNAQKVREALEKIAAWGPDPFIEPVNGDSSAIYENARSDENGKFLGREIPAWWGVAWRNDLKEFVALAKAALDATPRNCDRGRDAAEDAFTARFGRPWTQEEARVAEWLFEEEGRTGAAPQDMDGEGGE